MIFIYKQTNKKHVGQQEFVAASKQEDFRAPSHKQLMLGLQNHD